MNGYYSVFDSENKKIADCGSERDAVFLIHSRNKQSDGHYYQFNPYPGDIIDMRVPMITTGTGQKLASQQLSIDEEWNYIMKVNP